MSEQNSIEDLFRGRHFDREVIILCVRWYLRYKLSFRDLVEMMPGRGISGSILKVSSAMLRQSRPFLLMATWFSIRQREIRGIDAKLNYRPKWLGDEESLLRPKCLHGVDGGSAAGGDEFRGEGACSEDEDGKDDSRRVVPAELEELIPDSVARG
jgi:hypothetical protein